MNPHPVPSSEQTNLPAEIAFGAAAQTSDPINDAPGLPIAQPSSTQVYSRNVVVSVVKIVVFASSGVLLPAYLTHRLPSATYGGLVLILQIASYIGYLDLGIQTAVAKYIAQYAAAASGKDCNEHASAGSAITFVSGLIGLVLSFALSLSVPTLFRTMPDALKHDVAQGVLLVGCSTAILLAASPFAAFFLGLQRYAVPTFVSITNKLIYVVVMVVMVTRHSSLTAIGAAIAGINVLTAAIQVGAWRILIPNIHVRPSLVVWPVVKRMLGYCAVLGIWTSGILIITGLDTTIVGHFDFRATAFYAIAATPITFVGLVLQAALNPLMPAVSALSLNRTSGQLGALLVRSTRYITLVLAAVGLPLILFGHPLLLIWVGPVYAEHSLYVLRILVLAQMIRNVCGPYATMVIATGTHKNATLSGVVEAVVNLASSILLGRFFGAIGVAYGTLIGAVVGVLIHFLVSVPRTQHTFKVAPMTLFVKGVLRPSITMLPTILFLPFLWTPQSIGREVLVAIPWLLSSLALAWYTGLFPSERLDLLARLQQRLGIYTKPQPLGHQG